MNKIASDFTGSADNWGVWIKEGDPSALRYWLISPDMGASPVRAGDRDGFFGDYDGSAEYSGTLNGYAHHDDGGTAQAGKFRADIRLDAMFDAGDGGDTAEITGTVSGFRGADGTYSPPGWGDVNLTAGYTAQGAGTASDASGYWSPDYVYGVTGTEGSDRRPRGIRGVVGLEFGGDSPGAAAGVFDAPKTVQ